MSEKDDELKKLLKELIKSLKNYTTKGKVRRPYRTPIGGGGYPRRSPYRWSRLPYPPERESRRDYKPPKSEKTGYLRMPKEPTYVEKERIVYDPEVKRLLKEINENLKTEKEEDKGDVESLSSDVELENPAYSLEVEDEVEKESALEIDEHEDLPEPLSPPEIEPQEDVEISTEPITENVEPIETSEFDLETYTEPVETIEALDLSTLEAELYEENPVELEPKELVEEGTY